MKKLRLILLAAFLLLSQSGILLHQLDAEHYDSAHISCDVCLSENGLDGALSPNVTASLAHLWGNADRLAQPKSQLFSRPNAYYQSRAPPFA